MWLRLAARGSMAAPPCWPRARRTCMPPRVPPAAPRSRRRAAPDAAPHGQPALRAATQAAATQAAPACPRPTLSTCCRRAARCLPTSCLSWTWTTATASSWTPACSLLVEAPAGGRCPGGASRRLKLAAAPAARLPSAHLSSPATPASTPCCSTASLKYTSASSLTSLQLLSPAGYRLSSRSRAPIFTPFHAPTPTMHAPRPSPPGVAAPAQQRTRCCSDTHPRLRLDYHHPSAASPRLPVDIQVPLPPMTLSFAALLPARRARQACPLRSTCLARAAAAAAAGLVSPAGHPTRLSLSAILHLFPLISSLRECVNPVPAFIRVPWMLGKRGRRPSAGCWRRPPAARAVVPWDGERAPAHAALLACFSPSIISRPLQQPGEQCRCPEAL